MEKGLLPHSSARGASARSEEARLAYVALTRAADELVVTWTDSRGKRQSGPSPFLPTITTAIRTSDPPPPELRELSASRAKKTTPDEMLTTTINAWCTHRARVARIEPQGVLATRQVRAIVRARPQTTDELASVTHVVFARRYGEEILQLVRDSASN